MGQLRIVAGVSFVEFFDAVAKRVATGLPLKVGGNDGSSGDEQV
jgi:hypothetical protein